MKLNSDNNELTSSPVPASISRNRSTRVRTSLADLALLTRPRNGRVLLIKDANAKTNQTLI